IAAAVELKLLGLDSDSTAVPVTVLLDTKVNDAPATLDTTPLIVSKLGLYCNVKLPEVTPRPLLNAMGMPLPGTLLATLIVASAIGTPGVVELKSWLVAVARALWKVTRTLAPEDTSLVTMTTELGVLPALLFTPTCFPKPPLVRA